MDDCHGSNCCFFPDELNNQKFYLIIPDKKVSLDANKC